MSLIETMLSAVNGPVGQQIASQFGLNTGQIGSIVSAVAPALAGGMKEKLAAGGGGGLMDLLNSGALKNIADNPTNISSSSTALEGQNILGQLFGGGSALTGIVSAVAEKTGIGSSVIQSVLPIVTSLFMGLIAKSATNTHTGQVDPGHLTSTLEALAGGHHGLFDSLKSAAGKIFG